jgi:hypothetical protein
VRTIIRIDWLSKPDNEPPKSFGFAVLNAVAQVPVQLGLALPVAGFAVRKVAPADATGRAASRGAICPPRKPPNIEMDPRCTESKIVRTDEVIVAYGEQDAISRGDMP